jgi:hypothetical protein
MTYTISFSILAFHDLEKILLPTSSVFKEYENTPLSGENYKNIELLPIFFCFVIFFC